MSKQPKGFRTHACLLAYSPNWNMKWWADIQKQDLLKMKKIYLVKVWILESRTFESVAKCMWFFTTMVKRRLRTICEHLTFDQLKFHVKFDIVNDSHIRLPKIYIVVLIKFLYVACICFWKSRLRWKVRVCVNTVYFLPPILICLYSSSPLSLPHNFFSSLFIFL